MRACRACNGFLSENSGANAIACTECVHLKGCKFESPAEELVDSMSVKEEEEEAESLVKKRPRRSKGRKRKRYEEEIWEEENTELLEGIKYEEAEEAKEDKGGGSYAGKYEEPRCCPFCDQEYSSAIGLRHHKRVKHLWGPFICPECNYKVLERNLTYIDYYFSISCSEPFDVQ